ncbi:FAD/NAD(P)-binding domain-containing protein [Gonapodya prolifera JEL478]|uniref:FAD/NAD(P)-binding domain-containing protein n=1 Tax=Gonapodya prolifera (strain JEL478) TaxID=1344416 RepID=A0A139AW31_GONPJ|nr:FAD/NAD(P)-binding domain-containing protein [Gonapodya prolifera JEL478]|eukprot:KXS20930.1 FAD/NAD(P)-binding domain-containing protein [Gonapodya prolifera JEL478]
MTVGARPQRIAVIGAGAAGLVAARELQTIGGFKDIVVFEAQADVGGVCRVEHGNPELDIVSSGYKEDPLQRVVDTFDAVVVANVHYIKPYIPDLEGVEKIQGRFLHSRDFRNTSEFDGRTVLVIGSGTSVLDLSRILASYAKQIYLSLKDPKYWDIENLPELIWKKNYPIQRIAPVAQFSEEVVELENGSALLSVDVVIFDTGYLYDFPFLKHGPFSDHGAQLADKMQKYRELIGGSGEVVVNLYKKAIYAHNTKLAFVGLPLYINSFPLLEFQSALITKIWSGEVDAPSADTVIKLEEEEARKYNWDGRLDKRSVIWTGVPQRDYQAELTTILGIWEQRADRAREFADISEFFALRNRLVFDA